jgi:hypothetical protein
VSSCAKGGEEMHVKPFQLGGVLNLANNEEIVEIQLAKIPKNRVFVVECVGVNGFVQNSQTLFVSLEVFTNGVPGIYPLVTNGTSTISDPAFPARRFASQQISLYADPDSQIVVAAARHDAIGTARISVDLCGRLIAA